MEHNCAPCFERFPVDRFLETLSEILSEKHDAKITITAIPKEERESA